jgi:hypothetical protein
MAKTLLAAVARQDRAALEKSLRGRARCRRARS